MLGGCVQQAVLENDVRSAQWKARTLATAVDPGLAYAALASQLVELEALYQRDPSDQRVLALLDRGYRLLAEGFIELRYLQALADGDTARADAEAALRADAEARASYYRARLGAAPPLSLRVQSAFVEAKAACEKHDASSYEARLHALSAQAGKDPEERLEDALVRRLAAARLAPALVARCGH